MQLIATHLILISASSMEKASAQVEDFFANTLLVRYDRIEIRRQKCYSGTMKPFHAVLENGVAGNRKTLQDFVLEFEKTGFQTSADLPRVEHGYPSKLLHIITHFLDGFIGIDTTFYNLIEDSHWVSEDTRRSLLANPENFWLVTLDAYSATPEKAAIVHR
jgi:hypothetical protein